MGGREGDSFISPELQAERCRALAAARGLEVGEILSDRDRSGGKMDRPALNEAIARISAGKSSGIIVARLDRFSRTVIGGLKTIEEINNAGGVVLTAEGDFDTSTATGELVLGMMLQLAQFELRRISEGWDATAASMIERGIHSGQVPAGYDRGANKRLVPNQFGAVIKQAFETRAAGGSWTEVAQVLTVAGVPTSRGATTWSLSGTSKLLRNPVYLGEARRGKRVNAAAHEPIVTRALFERANAKRDRRSATRGKGEGPLLARLLRCGSCGHRLTLDFTVRNGKRYEFYRCRNSGACPGRAAIGADVVEPYVTHLALQYLGDVHYEEADSENLRETDLEQELAEAEQEIAAYVQHVPATTTGFAEGLATREAVRTSVIGQMIEDSMPKSWVYLSAGETLERFQGMSVHDKRSVIAACIGRATIRPGRARVEERVGVGYVARHPLPTAPQEGRSLGWVRQPDKRRAHSPGGTIKPTSDAGIRTP